MTARARSVFILDDEEPLCEDLCELISAAGHRARWATDPRALDMFELAAFDVVLLDLGLPAMDGIDIMNRLAAFAKAPRLILISGVGEDVLRVVAQVAGEQRLTVLGALTKPLDPEQLLRLLDYPDCGAAQPAAPRQAQCAILPALKASLADRTLPVSFQPKVGTQTLVFAGAEALLTGVLPDVGPVSPLDIVAAAASDPSVLVDLTQYVLGVAARGCAQWIKAGWQGPVSVNLPLDVVLQSDCLRTLIETVDAAQISRGDVIFELTEDSLYDSCAESLSMLARLRMAGFGLALDDVGRRQSGLLQLSALPVTEIKIDLQIVRDARTWTKARNIFASIAELGRKLGIKVVAEGVEFPEDLNLARTFPIDYVQGYLISPKRPLPELLHMLSAHTAREAASGDRKTGA
ncbi:EAL domain-containing response regulator [Roseixanthobacter glucoisosaccharinicivorans]|uniref:EAL domain-containing response regulator n=1 Tax=Roseixanthobacter glucoisosaccharinicivorans TaxID=3119923 RepID=UPI00372BAC7B